MHKGFMGKYTNDITGISSDIAYSNCKMFNNTFQMQTSDICRIVGLLSRTAILKSLLTRYSFMVNGPRTNAGTNNI